MDHGPNACRFHQVSHPAGPSATEQGSFITPMPDFDANNDGIKESAKKWNGDASAFDSFSTKDYPDGFDLEFDYAFDTSRGDGTFGYVQAYNANGTSKNKKLSFVGNSGVKFGSQADGKPYEAAIIDNDSFDSMVGGIKVEHFIDHSYPNVGTDGKVDDVKVPSFDAEPLSKLMSGVEYGGAYDKMADTGYAAPQNAAGFLSAHQSNLGRINRHMKLILERLSPTEFKLQVILDGQLVYKEDLVTAIMKFSLQSHWGSGVSFSNMKVSKLS